MPILSNDTVSEQAAEPSVVDEPDRIIERELDADTTSAPGIVDTGYIWDQSFPGEWSVKPEAEPPRLLANRVTEVSDSILYGSAELPVDTPPFILVPAHRDRVRVTVQNLGVAGEPAVFLGHGPDAQADINTWSLQAGDVITFRTRAVIYAQTVGGAGTVTLQWAAELVAEGCGCL